MPFFSKIMGGFLLGSALVLPYMASSQGWGFGTERNPMVIKQTRSTSCPPHRRTVTGHCRYGHRSYFGSRSVYGGGPRRGK